MRPTKWRMRVITRSQLSNKIAITSVTLSKTITSLISRRIPSFKVTTPLRCKNRTWEEINLVSSSMLSSLPMNRSWVSSRMWGAPSQSCLLWKLLVPNLKVLTWYNSSSISSKSLNSNRDKQWLRTTIAIQSSNTMICLRCRITRLRVITMTKT